MANKYTNLNDLFTAMANAIRLKNESTGTIIADNFPTEIANLKTRFDYNNQNVTALPDYAFYGCEGLNNVDCYNLTSVGASAFENCKNLKTVILYDGVESVGENAFKGCSEDLTIYCMFDSQPDTWHDNWNPNNCEVVWNGAIETWDISAAEDDNVIAKLYNDIKNEGYYMLSISGSGDMTDYNSHVYVPWYNYRGNIKSINILDSVTSIGNWAFSYCESLTSIAIPNSVTRIDYRAFADCKSLTSISIPNSVTYIGDGAFLYCNSLASINIPDGVTSISDSVFYCCTSLTSINIPDSVTSICIEAFRGCRGLTSINIPDSITHIGDNAFYECISLTGVYITNLTAWYNIEFMGGSSNPLCYAHDLYLNKELVTELIIPDSVTSISDYTFYKCTSLTSITVPNSVTHIGSDTFYGCIALTSITISDSVTNIGSRAFYNTFLTSIIIPNSVTSIGIEAFCDCGSLTSITYTGTIAQWNAITFGYQWNFGIGDYTIHCIDGDIAKDGTITYHATT